MRALLQRVSAAQVKIDGQAVGTIDTGLLVLLGVDAGDDETTAAKLAQRTAEYRLFADAAGKMNRSLSECGGSLLVVPQFTLSADTRRGRRPSFASAASPHQAESLYEHFVSRCRERIATVETGRFGANMQVHSINDGPVTFLLRA
ncbi:MAG: D-tyrosyl-tRNA(Tyr) deacylase [Cellvibrionales bacterium]|nr:D-tyrosyl-tRNA(Tyr) deacylase [Cellvibrionales bacterium]